MWNKGTKLKEGYNRLSKEIGLKEYTQCIGLPPHTQFVFKDAEGKENLELKSLFLQETVKRGILFSGVQNLSFSHTDKDIERTLTAIEEAFAIMKKAINDNKVAYYLEGKPVEPVFRRP
jgi:glutamate-1-semialdehyde aminotransferase